VRATTIVHQAVGKSLCSVHQSRLKAVFFAVEALVHGGRLSLTALGRSARGPVAPKHSIKRIDRLLGNPRLHRELEVFFRALTKQLLTDHTEPLILVDWTRIDEQRYALSAAVPVDGRALPIYWEVHDKRLLGNRHVQTSFLATLTGLVPDGCWPVVVTDAGFGNHWFRAIVDMGWDYVGRTIGQVCIRSGEGDEWRHAHELYTEAGGQARDLGPCDLGLTNRISARIVLAKRYRRNPTRPKARRRHLDRGRSHQQAVQRAKQPWVLATSLPDKEAKAVVRIYGKRMQIEESYRDAKNHRWGWSFRDARATTDQRYMVLLLVASLAMLALTLVGQAAESRGWHRRYQANTIRKRRVLSLFVLGKAYVDRQETEVFLIRDLRASLGRIRARIATLELENTSDFVGIP
jgi:hypothetical protein